MEARLREHVDLQPFNTLALPARARYFLEAATPLEVAAASAWSEANGVPLLVLGGGSNIVLRGDWPGLVLRVAIAGRRIEDLGGAVRVAIGAGENWHELVQWSLREGLYGIENLTSIPGTVGAAPIQNIGAYGVELRDVLDGVRGIALPGAPLPSAVRRVGELVELSAADCELGYRDSIFKHALRDRFIITEVALRLSRRHAPVLTYPPLDELHAPDAAQIEQTVRALRQRKLPDPAELPNVGSFFKNPVVDAAHFARLRAQHADIPSFDAPAGVKLPAAWLVDRCGWKGRRQGDVGVHEKQALVLVNYARGAAGAAAQLLALAAAIQSDVRNAFGVELEMEPTVYGAA